MIRTLLAVLGPGRDREIRTVVSGAVLAAVLQGCAFVLLVPVLTRTLSGQAAAARPWLTVMTAVCVCYAALTWWNAGASYRLGATLARTLHHRIADHVVRLPLGWFSGERVGSLSRLTGPGVVSVMSVPAHLIRPLVEAVITPATIVALMFLFDWRIATAALLALPLLAATHRWTARLAAVTDHTHDAASAAVSARVIEFTRLQPVLRAFGRTATEHRLLDDALAHQHAEARTQLRTVLPGLFGFAFAVQAAFTAVLMTAVFLAIGGTAEPAELLALLVLAVRCTEPALAAAEHGAALRVSRNCLDRIQDVLNTPPLPEPEATTPVRDEGSIELDGVTFGYGDQPVLTGASLRVPARTMTALVGPSGSGKTTITRLVARFADVDSGTIRVDGVDVRDQRSDDLMARLSLVFQDVYLFDGTIEDNIRIARSGATDTDLREAARLARVDEIVARLPLGWNTPVGEGGARLSGGERQRVSIARALLKNAPIVLLDEATAALDQQNEAAVQEALHALTTDRTLLVIAHRLPTVMAADQIAVLDQGHIIQTGTHTDLLSADGPYARFWTERTRASGWHLTKH